MMDHEDIYDAMTGSDIIEAIVRYNGSGDEGYIEDVDFDPPIANRAGETDAERDARWSEIDRILHDAAYDILEDQHPGWEINEGSQGTITFNAEARTTRLHHGDRVETIEWYDEVEV